MPNSRNPRGFGSKLWADIERPLRHFITDGVYSLCALALIELFWEGIRALKLRGYPTDESEKLEHLHFAIVYLALLAIGLMFLYKLVALLWNTSKKH
jgi:hypothetical protein